MRHIGHKITAHGFCQLDGGHITLALLEKIAGRPVKAKPLEILRQYMAKAESPTRGRELNIHYGDLERGFGEPALQLRDRAHLTREPDLAVCASVGEAALALVHPDPDLGPTAVVGGPLGEGAEHVLLPGEIIVVPLAPTITAPPTAPVTPSS